MLTVEQAKADRCCRICKKKFDVTVPRYFIEDNNLLTYPEKWTFAYGKEFAHTACLENVSTDNGCINTK